jgi:aminopeptidase N
MARPDPHSFADDAQPTVDFFDWTVKVDFERRVLEATAALRFTAPAPTDGPLDLDTRGLAIEAVTDEAKRPLRYALHEPEGTLGAKLRVQVPAGARGVSITYRTSPHASALQWLEPSQTHGGTKPYLFTQCQAIHARSILPCQDTPARRVTYRATIVVPDGLKVVMAAAAKRVDPVAGGIGFFFEMPQPIPPYLVAFAVGDLEARELSPRCRVWSEPGMVEAAAWEFADVEKHLAAAESLFGPYDWERFDLLVMPPSFPYGGMENPRLTFITPTLLAGDRSLVSVVAHELAHSWTGNLVTNLNAEHFWLNEGFTVFAERRIVEALSGRDLAELHAAIGLNELEQALARFEREGRPELTRLRTHLAGVDPDDAFSVVPYEKGYLFLRALETAAGREAFDRLLKSWLAAHRFGAVTTDDWVAHCERELPGLLAKVGAERWLNQPGLPADAPRPASARLEAVRSRVGTVPPEADVSGWSAAEWKLFLDWTPRTTPAETLEALDARFGFSQAKNAEVFVSWLTLGLQAGLPGAVAPTLDFLSRVGRMKYLKPLYGELVKRDATRAPARACFDANRARYHPIAQQVVAALLQRAGA